MLHLRDSYSQSTNVMLFCKMTKIYETIQKSAFSMSKTRFSLYDLVNLSCQNVTLILSLAKNSCDE